VKGKKVKGKIAESLRDGFLILKTEGRKQLAPQGRTEKVKKFIVRCL